MPGKIEARNKTDPNSNMREFHVDRLCEMYNLISTGFEARIGVSIDSDEDDDGRNGSASSVESPRDMRLYLQRWRIY